MLPTADIFYLNACRGPRCCKSPHRYSTVPDRFWFEIPESCSRRLIHSSILPHVKHHSPAAWMKALSSDSCSGRLASFKDGPNSQGIGSLLNTLPQHCCSYTLETIWRLRSMKPCNLSRCRVYSSSTSDHCISQSIKSFVSTGSSWPSLLSHMCRNVVVFELPEAVVDGFAVALEDAAFGRRA